MDIGKNGKLNTEESKMIDFFTKTVPTFSCFVMSKIRTSTNVLLNPYFLAKSRIFFHASSGSLKDGYSAM